MAAEVRLTEAQVAETIAKAIKAIADAEAAEAGPQLDIYKAEINALLGMAKAEQQGAAQSGPADGG
jgi:hypothetical protein